MARVFVSYARKTSAAEAEALSALLRAGGHDVFFDRTSIEDGAEFPRAIVDALLEAHAFVALFDEAYAGSWYCVRELRVALAAWTRAEKSGPPPRPPRIVIGLGQGVPQNALDRLPPDLRTRNWRSSSDLNGLAASIGEALRGDAVDRFGTWLREHDDEVVELKSAARLPPAVELPRHFPDELPPSLGERFYGRTDELWSIHLHLVVLPRSEASTVLLQGFAGVGKSRLALEYVHRFAGRHFPGGVFWLDAGVPEIDFVRQLHDLARSVGAVTNAEGDPRAALVEWASRQSKSMLLVVDNLPPDTGKSPMSHWCVLDGHAAVLATTRERRDPWEKHVRAIEVGALGEDAATLMLSSGLDRRAATEASWSSLANAVGGIPLALELLNTGVRLGVWNVSEIESRVAREGSIGPLEEAFEALRLHVPGDALRGVVAVFEASFSALSPDAQRVAERLATLSPAPIPNRVVVELAAAPVRVEMVKHLVVLPVASERDIPMFGQMHRMYAEFLNARDGAPRWSRWLPWRQRRRHRVVSAIRDASAALATVLEKGMGSATLFALISHIEGVYALAMREQAGPEVSDRLRSAYVKAILDFANSRETHSAAFQSLQATIRAAVAGSSHEILSSIQLIDRMMSLDRPLVVGELELDVFVIRDPTGKTPNVTTGGFDPKDPEVVSGLRGPMPRALELYEIRKSILGETHLAALGLAAWIAMAMYALRDLDPAHHWYTIVHRACQKRYGAGTPNTLFASWHLCAVLALLGRETEMRERRDRDLIWLLDVDLGKLDPPLRRLRAALAMLDLTDAQLERALEANDSPGSAAALRGLLAGPAPAAAVQHFDRAIALGERSPHVFMLRYRARMAEGDLDGAMRDLVAARDAGLEPREYHSKAATILISQAATARDHAITAKKGSQALVELDAAIAAGSVQPNDYVFRGSLRRSLGRYTEAEADLRRAIALGADGDGPVHFELAKALCGQDRFAEAIPILTEIIGSGRGDSSAYLLRGEAFLETGRIDAARADVRKCLALDPSSEDALILEGRCLNAAGDARSAAARFGQALQSNSESGPALRNLLITALESQDFTTALDVVNRLLAQSPREPLLLLFKTQSLHGLGRHEEALEINRHLTTIRPDDKNVWWESAKCHFRLARFEEALSDFRRYAQLDPTDITARRTIFGCLGLLHREDEAMRELEAAIAEMPDAWELRGDHAKQLREDGRLDDAVVEYQTALRVSGGDSTIAEALVDILWSLDRDEDALSALELVPEARRDAWILNLFGKAFRRLQRYEQAKLQYGKAIAADPTLASPRYGRALVFRALNRPYAALTDLDSAVSIFPDESAYLVERAEVLLDVNRATHAAIDLRNALASAESPDLVTYGDLFLRADDLPSAAECLEKAVAADSNDTYTRGLLAEVLLYSGDIARAETLLMDDVGADDWLLLLQGLAYRASGDRARADLAFRKALAACDAEFRGRPLDTRELFNRALYLAVLGEHEAAKELYAATVPEASLTRIGSAVTDLRRIFPEASECMTILTSAREAKLRPR